MKTIRFQLLLLALFVMVGCQKDEMSTSMKKGSYSLVASIENNDSTSRTAVDENGGVTWVATDAIGVFGTQTKNAKFESIGAGANVTFVGDLESSHEEPTLAYYPYDENASLDGNALSFTLPSEYSYTGQCYAPMLGIKQADGNFVFKHLVGLLKVTVKNMPENAKRLFVVSEGTEEKAAPAITGNALINDVTESNATLSITENKGHEVSIDLKNASAQETYTFFIPVPVGEYPKLSVKLEMDDGVIYMDKSVSNVNITRALMLDMPVIDAEKEETGITAIVRGTVDIENPENIRISSLIDNVELFDDEFSLEVFSNELPQLIFVTDDNDNVLMMARICTSNVDIKIDAKSSVLALISMLPPFYCNSKDIFEKQMELVMQSSKFAITVEEMQKMIDTRNNILSSNNISFRNALEILLKDLFEQPQTRAIDGVESAHLNIKTYSDNVIISNTDLNPPYEYSIESADPNISYPNGILNTPESYGLYKVLTEGLGKQLGPPLNIQLFNQGEYRFKFEKYTEKAEEAFGWVLLSDIFSVLGVGIDLFEIMKEFNFFISLGKEMFTILNNYQNGSAKAWETYRDLTLLASVKFLDWANYVIKDGNLSEQLPGPMWKKIRKELGKETLQNCIKKANAVLIWYDVIKGLGNFFGRLECWANAVPKIEFKLCYYQGIMSEIVCCSETFLDIVEGDKQIGVANEQLEHPLVVSINTTSFHGKEFWNDRLYVKFEVEGGGGRLKNYVEVDEATKQASVDWVLGYSGEQKVKVVAIDLYTELEISEPVYFTAYFEQEEEEGTITTTEATNKTQTTATLSGNIQGYEADDFGHRYGIIYSTDANPTASNGTIVYSNNIQEDGNYSVDVASLTENTTYYYRAFVRNHGHYVYADDVLSFTTLKPIEDNEGMTEREILIAFYNATDGDNWSKKSEWCSDKPLGKWYGVTTDDEGHVIEISFTDYNDSNNYNYRKGDANLSGLKYLRKLYINSADQLTSLNVSGCVSLEELYCQGNLLNSLVMNNCPKLKKIGVGGNKLTRLDVKHLESLELLYTGSVNNEYTTIDISGLKNLKKAEFSGSKLSAIECEDCLGLEELALRNSSFTNIDLSHLTNLKVLDIEYNKLQSLELNELPSSLKTLNCYGNALTELSFYNSPNLEKLNCSNETLIKLDVSNLTKLKELDCSGSKITSLDVSTCTSLESLNCDGTSLTNINVKGLSNLKTLGLAGIEFVYELQHSTLVELDLTGCDNLEDLRLANTYLKKIYSLPSKIDKTNTSRIKYWGTKNWEKYKAPNHYGGYQYPEFIY